MAGVTKKTKQEQQNLKRAVVGEQKEEKRVFTDQPTRPALVPQKQMTSEEVTRLRERLS